MVTGVHPRQQIGVSNFLADCAHGLKDVEWIEDVYKALEFRLIDNERLKCSSSFEDRLFIFELLHLVRSISLVSYPATLRSPEQPSSTLVLLVLEPSGVRRGDRQAAVVEDARDLLNGVAGVAPQLGGRVPEDVYPTHPQEARPSLGSGEDPCKRFHS